MAVLSWTPALLAWLGEMRVFEALVTCWPNCKLALLEVVVSEQEPPAGVSVTLTV